MLCGKLAKMCNGDKNSTAAADHAQGYSYFGVAIHPAVDGKRSRVGLGFGVGLLRVLLG